MAKDHYFDITAKLDMMELKNALVMAEKEVATRFDFKGIKLKDILISKLIKRGIAGKALEEVKTEGISGGNTKVIYRIVDTIDKDEAKQIVKAIKALKIKVTPSIQGDEVRVSGKKIDDLQAVMAEVKTLDLKAPLVFGNFK
jgi:uncharacterized protein YajQ (UPF0234 family)